MEIKPIAYFKSPFTSKFGIPRQSGILPEVEGEVVFEKPYDNPDAIRGIEQFSHLWLIWEFSGNTGSDASLMVRPPRLGGNMRVGVFASRSPFRPNNIGLSCVELMKVISSPRGGGVGARLIVRGADLMDGTPIYDIKPYVKYADCHADARSGYTDEVEWKKLDVVFPESFRKGLSESDIATVMTALSQDPRPHYHRDPDRIYGMPYNGYDIRFRVKGNIAEIIEVVHVSTKKVNKQTK